MPTAATVSPAEYPTQYDFLLSFARGCPDFPYGECGECKGENAKEGQTIYEYITEFFDDDMGTEDFETVNEIHLKKFSNTTIDERARDYAERGRQKSLPGLYPQEAYALTALARMSVNKTLTNLKGVLGDDFSKESTEDWVKTLYTKGNKGYCIGMWRLLALTYYLNSGVREEPRLCCALTPVTEFMDGPCEDDEMEKVQYVPIKKTKKTKKQEEINMDMIKEFISKATSDQIKEISKSCMDRQQGLAAFERLAEDSEVVYECPEGWMEDKFEGETIWEHEDTSEICKPCENVEEAPKGKWNEDCDAIIW
tara:strand:- start:1402 stop:2331 length:930 start_codon:yes stop_codon:yes gene_type:complete